MTALELQIFNLLRKYRVQKHYRASADAKVSRYAVYVGNAECVTEPKQFVWASKERDEMTAREIVALIGGEQ